MTLKEDIITYLNTPASLDQIKFVYQKREHSFSKKEVSFINQNWLKQKSNHPKIYNGRLYDITDIKIGKKITLYYDIIDYKTRIAAEQPAFKKLCPLYQPVHLVAIAVLKTSDDKILIGSDLSFRNKLQFWKLTGGFFDADKDTTILDCLKRECQEEIGSFTFLNYKITNISKNTKSNFIAVSCLIDIQESSQEVTEFNTKHREEIPDYYEQNSFCFIDFKPKKIAEVLNCPFISLASSARVALESLF